MIFDEAHFISLSTEAPLAAQTLQCLGYHAKEEYIEDIIKEEIDNKCMCRN